MFNLLSFILQKQICFFHQYNKGRYNNNNGTIHVICLYIEQNKSLKNNVLGQNIAFKCNCGNVRFLECIKWGHITQSFKIDNQPQHVDCFIRGSQRMVMKIDDDWPDRIPCVQRVR